MEKKQHEVFSESVYNDTYFYEYEAWQNKELLSGIDEVGRGCLAGPVVACALILHPYVFHPLLKDSKLLTENQRLKAAKWIAQNAWYSFGNIDHFSIDRCNIYKATQLAMEKAYSGLISNPCLPSLPQRTLIDAMPLSLNDTQVLSFTKGESKSVSIAAASIMAKVMRDQLMQRFEHLYPGYFFAGNKGYGAQKHLEILEDKGDSLIHRKTFVVKKRKNHGDKTRQTSLFC